jgi:hypothetical protein
MIDEKPLETIHLYAVREEPKRPSLVPVIISLLALSLLVAFCVFVPYQQPELRKTLRIPAVPLPVKIFTVAQPVFATGIKTYPATAAHGTLTITNGSVISQQLSPGLIFTGNDGEEVTTDYPVYVPAGSAGGYGVAYVSAHAMSGKSGNIAAYDINHVLGSSVYIRNLRPFTGGQDAYSVKVITAQDKQNALDLAKQALEAKVYSVRAILQSLKNSVKFSGAILRVTIACMFVAYPHLPGYRIVSVALHGNSLLVDVAYTPRPRIYAVK